MKKAAPARGKELPFFHLQRIDVPRPGGCFGRANAVLELTHALFRCPMSSSNSFWIRGSHGCGKSTLARACAHVAFSHRLFPGGVFHCSLAGITTEPQLWAVIGLALGLGPSLTSEGRLRHAMAQRFPPPPTAAQYRTRHVEYERLTQPSGAAAATSGSDGQQTVPPMPGTSNLEEDTAISPDDLEQMARHSDFLLVLDNCDQCPVLTTAGTCVFIAATEDRDSAPALAVASCPRSVEESTPPSRSLAERLVALFGELRFACETPPAPAVAASLVIRRPWVPKGPALMPGSPQQRAAEAQARRALWEEERLAVWMDPESVGARDDEASASEADEVADTGANKANKKPSGCSGDGAEGTSEGGAEAEEEGGKDGEDSEVAAARRRREERRRWRRRWTECEEAALVAEPQVAGRLRTAQPSMMALMEVGKGVFVERSCWARNPTLSFRPSPD